MASFNANLCKSGWVSGFKIKQITDICTSLDKIAQFLGGYKKMRSNLCVQVKSKVENNMISIVDRWKETRKAMASSKDQYEKSAATKSLLRDFVRFGEMLQSAYSTALGKLKLPVLSKEEVLSTTAKRLTEKEETASLVELEILDIVLNSAITAVKTLPTFIKRNGKESIAVSTKQANEVKLVFKKLLNRVITLLKSLCSDKKPSTNPYFPRIPKLIARAESTLKQLLAARSLTSLFTMSIRFHQLSMFIPQTMNSIKTSMLPCKLIEEQIESDQKEIEDTSVKQLREFLGTVEPLAHKKVKKMMQDAKNLINECKDGIQSPVGKLVDVLSKYIDKVPLFNIPMIVCLTPKLSVVALKSFQESIRYFEDVFVSMVSLIERCHKCKPQDLFGKSNLMELSRKLDSYITPMSETTSHFITAITFAPRGLALIRSSLEQVSTALQTLWRSETGFTLHGIKEIVKGFRATTSAVKNIIGDQGDELYKAITGTYNKDIKEYKELLKHLSEKIADLYRVRYNYNALADSNNLPNGRLDYLKAIYEKMESRIEQISITSLYINNVVSPIDRRFKIIMESSSVLDEVAGLFKTMYSMHLGSKVISHIDTTFAPQVAIWLGRLKENVGKLLGDSISMIKTFGLTLPSIRDRGFSQLNVSHLITRMVKSSGRTKQRLASQLSSRANNAAMYLAECSRQYTKLTAKFVGGISRIVDTFETFKKKMTEVGKIYGEQQLILVQIKKGKGPVSKIGQLTDSSEELITSLNEYDLNKLLSADPSVVPRKVKELQELFRYGGGALREMSKIISTCKVCKADKVFGHHYLTKISRLLNDIFNRMFERLNSYAITIGDSIGEIQHVKTATKNIKLRFNKIFQKHNLTGDTLMQLSDALIHSSADVNAIATATEKVVELLFDKDVNLQVMGSTISNIIQHLSKVMKSQVVVKAERFYIQAKKMKVVLAGLKANASKLGEGPIRSRLEVVKAIASETETLMSDLPSLFQLSNDTLRSAGIDKLWLNTLGSHVEKLTDTVVAFLSKTTQAMKSADIEVTDVQDIKKKLTDVKRSINEFVEAPWDRKIVSAQSASKIINALFKVVIDLASKGAITLGVTLQEKDLKSAVETKVGKERLAKFQAIYKRVRKMAIEIQKSPISNIGVLTDSIETLVDSLTAYDFGKVLLQNPANLYARFLEFRQLSQSTGDFINDTQSITGLCGDKSCDAKAIFGKTFMRSFVDKLEWKFTEIGRNFSSISKHVSKSVKGWKSLVSTAKTVSARFKGIAKGDITSDTLANVMVALMKSQTDMELLSNGSSIIFQIIFNGDRDLTSLHDSFEELVKDVGGVLNKTSQVLHKVGKVFQSVQDVRKTFSEINADVYKAHYGPIESRMRVLEQITRGINTLAQTLPVILNQSSSVVATLGVDSLWYKKIAGHMVRISVSLCKVINKTNIILDGTGVPVKDSKDVHSLLDGISKDYTKIISVQLKKKFGILQDALVKVDSIFNTTDGMAELVEATLHKVSNIDVDLAGDLAGITHIVTGAIAKLKSRVVEIVGNQTEITTILDTIKSGHIQKIGKLSDTTTNFVNSLKNYDIADILVLGPKFSIEKLGDLKDIVYESGTLLKNISSLAGKNCSACDIDSLFRKGFVKRVADTISINLRNITVKALKMLYKVEEGATNVRSVIISVKCIVSQVDQLKKVSFSESRIDSIANALHKSSQCLEVIRTDSSNVFRMLFNDSVQLKKLTSDYGDFITQMRAFLNKAGEFSHNISQAFSELHKIEKTFNETQSSFQYLTRGPMQSRIEVVKGVVNGVNSIMSKFENVLKIPKVSSTWLKEFGDKLDKIIGGVVKVLSETVAIAGDLGESVQGVQHIIATGKTIRIEFNRLSGSESLQTKIKIASSIVGHIKALTSQVGEATTNASTAFDKLTDVTVRKTNIFGDGTEELSGEISMGISTIADRYEIFQEHSRIIKCAFDKIEEDPIKFVTEELPKLFNQSSQFLDLMYSDVKGIASKLGLNIDKFNIDNHLVVDARSYYTFAKSTLNAIRSGQTLVTKFTNLLHPKAFKERMLELKKIMASGESFMKSIDKLGKSLFKNWDAIKEKFQVAIDNIGASVGISFQNMGSYLEQGLKAGESILKINGTFKGLLSVHGFTMGTLVKAAGDIVSKATEGVEAAKEMGMSSTKSIIATIQSGFGKATAFVDSIHGMKDIFNWLTGGGCHVATKALPKPHVTRFDCWTSVIQTEQLFVREEECYLKKGKIITRYEEGKINCSKKECIRMQNISCLSYNEECLQKKLNMSSNITTVSKALQLVYQNYHKKLGELQGTERDVEVGIIKLHTAKYAFKGSQAVCNISKWTMAKSSKTIDIMTTQQKELEKIIYNKKCKIVISKVEFNVTSYEPAEKLIPLRIHMQYTGSTKTSTMNVIVNFDSEPASFSNIAQLIVSRYTEYIPMSRFMWGTDATPVKHIGEDRGAEAWKLLCIKYQHVYLMLQNIISILHDGIMESSDSGNVGVPVGVSPSASSSELEGVKKLQEALKKLSESTTENVKNVIARWERTAEHMWSENIGSVCIGFDDCFSTQMKTLSDLLEPHMKGYHTVLEAITTLMKQISTLRTTPGLTKSIATEKMKKVLKTLDTIDKNACLCDEKPVFAKEMPLSAVAHLQGNFDLACTIEGPASMEFRWWKDNQLLPKQKSWKLELDDVTVEDRGYYECEGKTLTSSVKSNKVLIRIYEAMQILTHPIDHVLDYPGGKDIMLHCNGSAQPEAIYKWWFKPYIKANTKSIKPRVVSHSSILNIKRTTVKNTGQYWCELSNGYSSVNSQKAKVDIVRVMQRKASARLHLALSINKDDAWCSLPPPEDHAGVITALQTALRSAIDLPESDVMTLSYKTDITDESKANLTVSVSLLSQQDETPRESATSAFHVSKERSKLNSLLTTFVDKLKLKVSGLQVPWKQCNISVHTTEFTLNWVAEDLACPPGMGPSSNFVKCVQCSPGSYDNGKGHCVPCPTGTYQAKAGQTTCYPCGDGLLTLQDGTPAVDECVKTEYVCDNVMSLVIVLDASSDVTAATWKKTKSFVSRLSRHFKLADDAVKLSIVSVGGEAKVEVTSGSLDAITKLPEEVQALKQIPGSYRHDLAFELASRLSRSPDYMPQEHAVLFIEQAGKIKKGKLVERAQGMKSDGIKLSMVLLNESNESSEHYLSLVSRPVERHFVNIRKTEEVSKWPTAVARSVCSGTPQFR